MNAQKIIISIFLIFFSFQTTNAWLGLFAQNGDIITVPQWNSMITDLHTKINQSDVVGTGSIVVNNSGSGVLVSFSGATSLNTIPYITPGNKAIEASTTANIHIEGLNFVPTSTITIPGFGGTINSTTINSPTDLDINITSTATMGSYDIVVTNPTGSNILRPGNGVGQLSVIPVSVWSDLRSGGDAFTHGNASGNDIRYRSGMNLVRDANGMYFTGSSPWSSWVKFESLGWVRGANKKLSWVFSRPSSGMMIGIGSTATNESHTSQYRQAEVEIYFSSSNNMWGLYGNTGTIGTAGSQGSYVTLTCASNIFKEVITNDGTRATGVVNLYCLPSASPSDWDDTSNLIHTVSIGGTLNPDEAGIMPFIIPINAGSQRFIAVKVD